MVITVRTISCTFKNLCKIIIFGRELLKAKKNKIKKKIKKNVCQGDGNFPKSYNLPYKLGCYSDFVPVKEFMIMIKLLISTVTFEVDMNYF